MQTLLGALGVLFGAGQFVVSLIDLQRRQPIVRSEGQKHPPANLLIPLRERRALQLMLISSATVALGAAAYLFAQQHYVEVPKSGSALEGALASYNRQRTIAWVGVGLNAIAACSALLAWWTWSRVPVWPREMILSVVLVVIAGLLLLALWDLPVLTRSRPSNNYIPSASRGKAETPMGHLGGISLLGYERRSGYVAGDLFARGGATPAATWLPPEGRVSGPRATPPAPPA